MSDDFISQIERWGLKGAVYHPLKSLLTPQSHHCPPGSCLVWMITNSGRFSLSTRADYLGVIPERVSNPSLASSGFEWSSFHPPPLPSPAALAAGGAQSKDLVLSLLVSCCCSCRWNSLWPLPLPALIPDLQSLGSSSEARSQHHGNPTSLSNHQLVWQRQHCRQEWVGQKSRVAAALRYTVWEWTAAVSLRGLATQMCTSQFLPLPCRSGRRAGKGGAGGGMPVRSEELRLRVAS